MRYCLLMHYQEGSSIGLTEEDMAPAMAAFAAYADDLPAVLDRATAALMSGRVANPIAAVCVRS